MATQNLTLAEELLYTTVRIISYSNGLAQGSGTGFFWRIEEGDGHVILLVTNKHVLDGADSITVICNGLDATGPYPTGQPAHVELAITEPPFCHSDSEVDLCAVGFIEVMGNAEASGMPLFIKTLDRTLARLIHREHGMGLADVA